MSGRLVVSGVHKSFGAQSVLRDVDLDVAPGSLTAILGSSGSGKTTLLRILAGFDRPDAGTIALDGRCLDDAHTHCQPNERGIGYVPQEGALFPHLTVASNVGFGLPRRRRPSRVADMLELTGLGDLAKRYPHQLSGGQQQRVALARALATAPTLMLLDEPFSSLDASMRASVRADVAAVLRTAGTTAVLVTHDQDEALSMADAVAVLRHGRFVQSGPPEDVYARPVDADVASFVGAANLLPAVADAAGARTALGTVPLTEAAGPSPTELTVLIRPEQLELVAAGERAGEGSSGRERDGTPATVVRCEYFGHDTVLTVELHPVGADGLLPDRPVLVRLAGESPLRAGAAVRLRVRGCATAWPRRHPEARPPAPSWPSSDQ